jgi:molybdate transport system substrate-binding protein
MHEPIAQQAVLLTRGAGNEAARAFLEYLRGDEAKAVIHGFGYAVE